MYMDPEQQEIQAAMRELSMLISQQTSLLGGTIKSLADTTTALKNGTQVQNANTQGEKENNNAVDKFAEANTKAAAIISEKSQNYKEAFGKGVSALQGFTGAVLSSEEGVAKYGKVVDDLGSGAFSIGQNFGILGLAIGGVLAIFGKVAKEVFKVDDNIVKIRDNFTKTAGIIPLTTTQIGDLAKNARFSLDNMAKLGGEMEKLGGNMMGLGGYAGEGAAKFMKMAAVNDDVRREFGRMGISQDALMHLQAKYIESQSVSGKAYANQSKSIEQIQKESLAYAKNMTVLSSLTGKSADALQEEINQVQLEFEEQAATVAENIKIEKMKKAGNLAGAEALQREQDNRKKMIETYTAMYGKDKASQMARVMRTGYYDSKTAGLAMLSMKGGDDPLSFTQRLKTSTNAQKDLLVQGSKMDKALDAQAAQFGAALQQGGAELGKKVGLDPEALAARNRRAGMDIEKGYEKAAADMAAKAKEGKDPLADKIESVRSFEREKQAQYQSFLESLDPLRDKNAILKDAVLAAAVAVGAIAAAKGLQALLGSGGAVSSVASGAAAVAGGAVSSAVGIAEDQLLDKNGNPLRGAAKSARIAKLGGTAQAGKPGGFGAALKSIASALTDAGKAAPQVILGAGALATAIAEFGAGIAGAIYIIGKSLPSLATGLKSFNDIDGKNLRQAGVGMAGLGVGIMAMGAGAMAQAFGTIIRFFTGDKDPLTQSAEMLFRLQKVDLNRKKIEDNGASLIAFAKAMAAVSALGAGSGIADAVQGFYGGIGKLFGAKPPYKDLETFSQIRVDTAKVKTNSDSFVYFTKAMASYKGTGGGLGGITSSLAQATVSFFKVKPPEQQVVYFSRLKIDPKQTRINASSFVLFSTAMASYKGGAGLLDAVSTIAGAKLASLFGVDGPLESFKKFAAIDVGPKAAENSQAFLNFSKAMGLLSGGSGGMLSSLADGAGAVAGAAVGVVGGAASAGLSALGSLGNMVGGAVSSGWKAVKGAAGSFGNWIMDKVAGHEGVRYKPYKDSLGLWTVGVGHLIGDGRSLPAQYNREFSHDEVKTMFQQDYQKHAQAATGIPGFNNQNEKSKAALIDMTFNMGPAWYRKWPNFTKALGAGDNQGAANQMQNSKWAKQVGRRAQENIAMIRAGAQKAKIGGMFDGPSTGYPMELHGTELVIPLDPNSILNKLASTSADEVAKEMQRTAVKTAPKPTSTTGTPAKTKGISKEMIHSMSRKFDNVINKIESTNNVQKKLLKHAL